MWLFENRPNKFERWVKKTMQGPGEVSDEEPAPKAKKSIVSNNQDIPPPTFSKAQSMPIPQKKVDVGFDLIDFNAPAEKGPMDFSDFQSAPP